MENTFELESVVKTENAIEIKNYESTFEAAKALIDSHPIYVIMDDTQKGEAKKVRANFNKIKDAIKNKRLSDINVLTGEYEKHMKSLEKLFDDAQKQWGEEIKTYENKEKASDVVVETKAKEFTATITFTDEKMIKKLTDFCEKNNLTITIK